MSVLRRLEDASETIRAQVRWRPNATTARMDPSAHLFTGIRYRLTFWYSAILGLILLLSGLLLYAGMQTVLLGPVTDVLQHEAQEQSRPWQDQGMLPQSCSPFGHVPYLIACFDSSGNLISANPLANLAPGFVTPSLARAALGAPAGSATDTVAGDATLGTIRRLAYVVHDPAGRPLGVLQVGLTIDAEVRALHTLLVLLLLVGVLTLLGSGVGGALLAARALAPARLAFSRQQEFIADASHELRTPLTLLRADAEVLLRGRERLDPDDGPLLDDIVVEVEHMEALAEHLLTLARLDHGVYHMEQDVVDLGEITDGVVHRARALAEARQIRLAVERVGTPLVIGDPTWLGEVALILLDNGIKYNRPGGMVTLRAYQDGPEVVLEVQDTGIGIVAEHLPHLGERFYRVDKARSRQLGGAGLGLSIARSVAAAHHGTLTLASVPERGTTATLLLPAADPARQEPTEAGSV